MSAADWHVRSIFHFILPCRDLERSIEFYERFGFRISKDNRNVKWPEYVGSNFNMKAGAQGRAVQLILPDAHELQTRIDLIQWLEPEWVDVNDQLPAEQHMPRVMALLTSNIQAAYQSLLDAGLEPTAPLRDPDPVIGVQGVVCFADPDGHIVELIEYFGDQLGSRTDDLPKLSG